MAKLLGIDIGTSGCKALLIDEAGDVVRQASAEYPISYPRPLWSEQNPEDWWNGVRRCLAEIGEPHPDAIGLTGQMHGAVFLDSRDQVVRPAILWNDQRTAAECEDIDSAVGKDRVREITCNPPLTGFQAPKILWLRKHEPEAWARVRSVLLPKDFIRLRLTGARATEVSDASGTGLLDVPARRWSPEMLAALDLDLGMLPEVFESSEVTGKTNGSAGLAPDIPVVGGGGDQAAGAVGTGAVAPGVISVSLGTSGVVFTAIERPDYDPAGAAHTFCHANGAWHAMGVMLSCGGAVKWFRDTLGQGRSYDQIAELAATIRAGADGAAFLPYLTGERCPHNDPLARSVFAGITAGHGFGHLARAMFEGVSFGLLDGMRLLRGLGASTKEVRVTSGGAKSRFWVQMLADLFEADCVTLQSDEGPAYGAAILAGVGAGVWTDVASACTATVRVRDRIVPSGTDYGTPYRRFQELYANTRSWNR